MRAKKFSLNMAVEDIPEGKSIESAVEVHFGLSWHLSVARKCDNLAVYLHCEQPNLKPLKDHNKWSVSTTFEIRLVTAKRQVREQRRTSQTYCDEDVGHGWNRFSSFSTIWKNDDRTAMVHCDVTITRMKGIAPKRHRSFEEPDEHLTDVILKVDEQEFHVSKVVLASQSRYFKAMFFGSFDDAKKEEVELKEVEADVFQVMLEILYGPFEIQADIVRDLLILADKFDVPLVRQRCEEYLLETDEVDKAQILLLADVFNLEDLRKDCLEKMTTSDAIKEYLPDSLRELSHDLIAVILEKNLLQS